MNFTQHRSRFPCRVAAPGRPLTNANVLSRISSPPARVLRHTATAEARAWKAARAAEPPYARSPGHCCDDALTASASPGCRHCARSASAAHHSPGAKASRTAPEAGRRDASRRDSGVAAVHRGGLGQGGVRSRPPAQPGLGLRDLFLRVGLLAADIYGRGCRG